MTRSAQAQQFHYEILQFINGTTASVEIIKQRLSSVENRDFILETSVNGHSHLMDVLHLSYEIPNLLNQKGSDIANTLFDLFKNHTTANEWQALLFKKCNRAFFPLQQALISGDVVLYKKCERAYLEILEKKHGTEKQALITKLFREIISNNAEGFNCLHSAIASKSVEILNSFLKFFQWLHALSYPFNQDNKTDLLSLLLLSDSYQNNPIHIAIFHRNQSILKNLNLHLFSICPTQKLPQLLQAFCEVSSSNLNMLMHAVERQDLDCLKTVFEIVKSELFNSKTYRQILLSLHQVEYSPLHLVLKAGKKEVFELFFENLIEAFANKLISEQELADIFLNNGTQNHPLLFNALVSTPEVYQYFLKCIQALISKKIINPKQWNNMLNYIDYSFKGLWIIALNHGAPAENLIHYLKAMRPFLKAQDQIDTLLDLNVVGFGVLTKIIKHQNIDLFMLYYNLMNDALQANQLSLNFNDLFYSTEYQTLFHTICGYQDPAFISFFFSKFPDKNNYIAKLIELSEQHQSSFYQLLQNSPEVLEIYFKKVKPYLNSANFTKLLTQTPANFSNNPVYQVLENPDVKTIDIYFTELLQVNLENLLDLFFLRDDDTALLHCLRHGHGSAMTYLCSFLSKLPQEIEQLVNSIEYQNFFNHHHGVKKQILTNYLLFVEHLMATIKIDAEKIKSALLPKDFQTKTFLNRLLTTGDHLLLVQYFKLLSQARDQKVISRDEYKALLLTPNYQSASPLCLAIDSNNTEVFEYFWSKLQAILKKDKAFSSYIFEFNLISKLSYSCNYQMTKTVYKHLEKLWLDEPQKLAKLIGQSCYEMVLANHPNQQEAKVCLAYLENKINQLEQSKGVANFNFFEKTQHQPSAYYHFEI